MNNWSAAQSVCLLLAAILVSSSRVLFGILGRWSVHRSGSHATLPGLLFTDANVHVKNALAESFVGYRLINCDNANLSLFAGARWTYLEGDLSIFDNGDARLVRLRELLGIRKRLDFSDSIDWVDPVIGMRGRVRIWKAMSLYAEGDVGGFDANADTAYELQRQGRRNIVRK